MAHLHSASDERQSLDEIDEANVRTGFRLARSLALQNAALDNRLTPACVRVLAAISYFMNDRIMRAWPGYDLLAEVTGYTYDVIDRSIRKLKATGYLRTKRHAPITGGRALVHYGYGRIDPEFLDNLIADAVAKIKERKADPDQKVRVSPTPTKKSGSEKLTPTFSSVSDSDFLSRQEPIRNRNPISEVSVANESSLVEATTLFVVDEVKPAKCKSRATGKRPWDWVHESERERLGEICKAYAIERGWPTGHLRDRLVAFDNHQRIHKSVSADWEASLLQWLGDPRFQPRPSRGAGRQGSNLETIRNKVFGGSE
ncbi:MAG: hypothetical protein JSR78_16250 [Proteobacteria bacterium]|nr:hypothetical protein [Pseudomonadota bacterium]